MRGFLLGLSLSVAFILGAVFTTMTQVPPAHAQSSGKAFSECMSATMWFARGRDINAGRLPKKTVKVPHGWTPIGGGGPSSDGVEPYVILCR